MKVFNYVYEVAIPQEQDEQIKEMQSIVNKISKALHKGTGGYYNDSLIEIEGICRQIIGEFWAENERETDNIIIPVYSDYIERENYLSIEILKEQLVKIRKMVKIEKLMKEL